MASDTTAGGEQMASDTTAREHYRISGRAGGWVVERDIHRSHPDWGEQDWIGDHLVHTPGEWRACTQVHPDIFMAIAQLSNYLSDGNMNERAMTALGVEGDD